MSSESSGVISFLQHPMLTDIESVKSVVLTAIDPARPPSPAQLSDVCKLTYYEHARHEVQRMIDRRIKYPYAYEPLVVLHVLIVVHYCLSHASSDFIQFCFAQANSFTKLVQYETVGTPAAREIAAYAQVLSTALVRPVQPSHSKAPSVSTAPKVIAFPNPWTVATREEGRVPPPWPLPSIQQLEPSKKEESLSIIPSKPHSIRDRAIPSKPHSIQDRAIPSKPHSIRDPTPDPDQDLDLDPDPDPEPVESVLLLQKEDIALMTFQRQGLMPVLGAVDELVNPKSRVRRHPDALVKALECVLYCLYWGSTPFLAQCKGKQTLFDLLCQHHNHKVRGRAYAVFNFLKGNTAAKQEEINKYSLIPHHTISPSIQFNRRAIHAAHGSSASDINISKAVTITRYLVRSVYSDIWEGIYTTKTGKVSIAIKFVRTLKNVYPNQLSKNLQRELVMWRSLNHKNVSPFYGAFVDGLVVGLVWPLYQNGTVLDYYEVHEEASPLDLLRGIADGVLYLHSKGIVHGNIKCSNVMVSKKGTPRLIDFGIFRTSNDPVERTGFETAILTSSLRWSAPEILAFDSPITSKSEKSDVYAFASTCIELITLEVPYERLSDHEVSKHVAIKGKTPPRPSPHVEHSPNDVFWRLLTSCWSTRTSDRPNMVAVRRKLDEITEDVPKEPVQVVTRKKKRVRWPAWNCLNTKNDTLSTESTRQDMALVKKDP